MFTISHDKNDKDGLESNKEKTILDASLAQV